jgi:hypothetical protein
MTGQGMQTVVVGKDQACLSCWADKCTNFSSTMGGLRCVCVSPSPAFGAPRRVLRITFPEPEATVGIAGLGMPVRQDKYACKPCLYAKMFMVFME